MFDLNLTYPNHRQMSTIILRILYISNIKAAALGANPAMPGFFSISINQNSVCYRFSFASVITNLISLPNTLTLCMIIDMIISRICT